MTPDEYKKANPLGGPAKMFDTIADRIRSGEDMSAVMDDYGISFKTSARPEGSTEPLPCPHCGSDPLWHDIEPHTHHLATFMPDYPGSSVIECCACGAGMIADTRAEVLAKWNRRS